jgi:serine protease AprX
MIKNYGVIICLVFCATFLAHTAFFAQQDTLKYWVQFTDKNNSIYNTLQPNQFLSQRAIDRRAKSQIAITEQDFPVNSWYVDSLLQFPSITLHNTSRWFNAVTIICDDTNAINVIENMPFVSQIKVVQKLALPVDNEKFTEIEPSVLNKNYIPYTTNQHYPYGLSYNQNHLHKVDYLHDLGFNGQGIHIAIIDSGFEYAHEMNCFKHLFEEGRILSTKDFVDHDGDVFWDHYHGTAVFSTMAALDEGVYYGTATKASYHLLRSEAADFEHIVEEDNWVSAAEYADSVGVDIINTSLGYTTFDDSLQNHTYADMDGNTSRIAIAADIAASKGILLVTSAGNSGDSPWRYISTPADADSTLTVGAVDSLGTYATFSSKGPASDGDVKPNVVSVGWNTYLYLPWGETIVRGNGTSFSSPMMAGMAACLWQALPDLNNIQIKTLIEQSAHHYATPDSLMGYGIPNIYQAYKSVTGIDYTIDAGIQILDCYPNPISSGELSLMVRSDVAQVVKLKVTNLLGQAVYEIDIAVGVGKTLIQIDRLFPNAGNYVLSIIDEKGFVDKVKIVSLK